MKKITMDSPVAHTSGSLDSRIENNRKSVTRYARIGEDQHGKPIYKQEMYMYHLHEGKWSKGAQLNRQLFQQAQRQARAELKDEARHAYWQDQFATYRRNYRQGDKLYVTLLGYVVFRIHSDLKSSSARAC